MSASSAATFAAPTTDQSSVLPRGFGPKALELLRVRGGLGTAESPGAGSVAVINRSRHSARKIISSRALVVSSRRVDEPRDDSIRERQRFERGRGRMRGYGCPPAFERVGGRLRST